MSIQTEIDRIITAVGAAYDAVEAKGGTAPAAQTIEGLAGAISGIKSAHSGPYMDAEYVAAEDGGITSHYIKRAKIYNHTAFYAFEFAYQYNLNSLDFSDASNNITTIEEGAFISAKLTGIVLPDTITSLQNNCFTQALIATLELPAQITEIPQNAFNGINAAYSSETDEELPINIILPPNLTKIGKNCFYSAQIKQISIPDTVTEIGEQAFQYCYGLTSFAIPPLLQKIPQYMLQGCENITAITIPAAVTEIGASAFEETGIASITIPATITTLGMAMLRNCVNLATINIQANVTEIPDGFAKGSGRTSVTLPDTVETIGDSAFSSRSAKLTEITIPASVTSIGDYAFAQNESMTTITCLATTPPTLGRNALVMDTINTTIKVPTASVAAYKAAAGWSTWADIITAI